MTAGSDPLCDREEVELSNQGAAITIPLGDAKEEVSRQFGGVDKRRREARGGTTNSSYHPGVCWVLTSCIRLSLLVTVVSSLLASGLSNLKTLSETTDPFPDGCVRMRQLLQ